MGALFHDLVPARTGSQDHGLECEKKTVKIEYLCIHA